jgi:hypothetical protein
MADSSREPGRMTQKKKDGDDITEDKRDAEKKRGMRHMQKVRSHDKNEHTCHEIPRRIAII